MRKPEIDALVNEAVAAALTEQAVRIDAILRHPEAEGRRDLAMTLALNSTLSADAAIQMLQAAPRAQASAERFLAAMAREGEIGVDSSGAQPTADARVKRMDELKRAAKTVGSTKYGVK